MRKYHLVFILKYRREIIYYELSKDTQQIIKDLCKWKEAENLMSDHVYILVSIPQKYSMSAVMGYLKRESIVMIFERHANLNTAFSGSLIQFSAYSFYHGRIYATIAKPCQFHAGYLPISFSERAGR